jgi:outer membrane protein
MRRTLTSRLRLPTAAVVFMTSRAILAQPAPPPAAADPGPTGVANDPPGAGELQSRLRVLLDKPDGLTSERAAQRAAATSLEVRVKEAELLAAAAEVDRALVAYYPRMTLTARYVRLSPIEDQLLGNVVAAPVPAGPIPPGTPLFNVPFEIPVVQNQYLLQANLTVPVTDYFLRTSQSVAASTESRAAAEIEARAARLSAAMQAKILYYGWARARLQEVVAAQSVEQTRSQHEVAKAAFAGGRSSRADVLAAESQHARALLLLERAQNLRIVGEEQLRTATHDPGHRPYEIGEDLLAALPSESKRYSVQQLYQEALQGRIELRAFDSAERSLVEQRRAARAGYYPRLDAFGNAYYANPNQRYFPQREEWKASWDLGVQLTWTPNDAGTSSALSAGLEARRARVAAQKAAFRDALRNEVTQAHQALREAEAGLTTTERGLAAAEEAYRVRRELYGYGRATTVEVIDAETSLLRAGLEMINARIEQRIARVRLYHALGRDARR